MVPIILLALLLLFLHFPRVPFAAAIEDDKAIYYYLTAVRAANISHRIGFQWVSFSPLPDINLTSPDNDISFSEIRAHRASLFFNGN